MREWPHPKITWAKINSNLTIDKSKNRNKKPRKYLANAMFVRSSFGLFFLSVPFPICQYSRTLSIASNNPSRWIMDLPLVRCVPMWNVNSLWLLIAYSGWTEHRYALSCWVYTYFVSPMRRHKYYYLLWHHFWPSGRENRIRSCSGRPMNNINFWRPLYVQ